MRAAEEHDFREFVSARIPSWRRSAFLLCGDRHRADDLVSTATGKLFRHWRRIAAMRSPDAYVRRMIVTAWLDEGRRPWRREWLTDVLPDRGQSSAVPVAAHDNVVTDRVVLLELLDRTALAHRTPAAGHTAGPAAGHTAGAAGGGAGTPPATTPAQQHVNRAARVLQITIAGSRQVKVQPPATRTAAVGGYTVSGEFWSGRLHLATLTLTARRGSPSEAVNPCTAWPGDVAGRQGAPAPDDRCSSVAQRDGTVAWIWRMGHSPSRPWTTVRTQEWRVIHVRNDGGVVELDVNSTIYDAAGHPIEATTPFDIDDSALVAVVTSPLITPVPS